MAKNKNRKQDSPHHRASRPEQAQEQEQRLSPEARQSPASQPHGSPADVARRKQKSFGHN